jgi:large subunit ribosomal protein L21
LGYAIIKTGGKQFKVEKNSKIKIPRVFNEIDNELDFKDVLLYQDNENCEVGKPYLENIKITAKLIAHCSGRKIKVFKSKRKKNMKRTWGQRELFSEVIVTSIEKK